MTALSMMHVTIFSQHVLYLAMTCAAIFRHYYVTLMHNTSDVMWPTHELQKINYN